MLAVVAGRRCELVTIIVVVASLAIIVIDAAMALTPPVRRPF